MSDVDDFASDDFDLEGFDDGFDNKESGTLGDLWRNNPFVKIGIILGVIALIVGIFILFSGDDKEVKDPSSVASSSDLTETPGSAEVSQDIRNRIEQENTNRLEAALRNNESVMPMPVSPAKGQIPFKMEKPEQEDPLERWRRLQEEKIKRAASKNSPLEESEEPEVDTRTPAIAALSESMATQMDSVLGNQELKGANLKSVAQLKYLEDLQNKEEKKREEALKEREAAAQATREAGKFNDSENDGAIILPAGTIEYAQLITEANTDVPGPILAEIVTGPFKGGRMIGSFEETYDYLTLNFKTIILDGVDYSTDAVAIDPDTTLPGLATDIDRRYFSRIVLPVAAEFISGFSQAIADSGTTTVTIQGDSVTETTSNDRSDDQEVASGISTAGQELSSIIKEIKDNNPQLLRVRAGTPIGILFVEAVTDEEDEEVLGPYQSLQNQQLLQQLRGTNLGAPQGGNTSVNRR